MDAFKLDMNQSQPDQQRQRLAFVMQKFLKRIETFHEPFGRRRHECCIARPGSSYPVLRSSEFAWSLIRPTAALEQNSVHFANEAQRKRKTLTKAPKAMLHGCHVIGNFHNIIDWYARRCVVFEQ